eukprot:scaffold22577_cov122-Cylindrotheca_fusiformis.AAC.7
MTTPKKWLPKSGVIASSFVIPTSAMCATGYESSPASTSKPNNRGCQNLSLSLSLTASLQTADVTLMVTSPAGSREGFSVQWLKNPKFLKTSNLKQIVIFPNSPQQQRSMPKSSKRQQFIREINSIVERRLAARHNRTLFEEEDGIDTAANCLDLVVAAAVGKAQIKSNKLLLVAQSNGNNKPKNLLIVNLKLVASLSLSSVDFDRREVILGHDQKLHFSPISS